MSGLTTWLLLILLALARPAAGQVVVAGTIGPPETDISPEQEQLLLGEYWTVTKRYRLEPGRAVSELGAWTRDRLGKVQSIQFQPAKPLPEYVKNRAEWGPDTLRLAAMLHTELALAAFQKRNIPEFEFQIGLADGWFILADNRQSAAGSLRSRWTVTVSRLLLASGEVGIAERILNRAAERIESDPGILLAQGTVKETQASRLVAELPGGRLDDPSIASKPRDAALAAAQAALEKALKVKPSLAEAKLRLAHVFVMKREDRRAWPLLKEILAAPPSPAVKYLGALMAGGVLERDGQLDASAKYYLEAILAAPDGQSAYLALANIMHRSGQAAEASAVLERLFARGITSATADPWWTYPLGLDLSIDAQFEEYRTLVRK